MTQKEYEQKKHECWEEFCRANPSHNKSIFAKKTLEFAFDRAYALGKQEIKQEQDAEDAVIQGWVARDFDGDVFLYQNEPDWNEIAWNGYIMHSLPVDSFPDLTWDSDPEEVEIILKRKKNGNNSTDNRI